MKIIIAAIICTVIGSSCRVQKINKVISEAEVTRIETTLSSDAMEGREPNTPGIEKAAAFIATEMEKAGLQPLPKQTDFMQPFVMIQATNSVYDISINGKTILAENVATISTAETITATEKSGYKIIAVKAGNDLNSIFTKSIESKDNVLLLLDSSFTARFGRIRRSMQSARFPQPNNIIAILTNDLAPATFSINIKQQLQQQKLANVTGMLRGKSKPDEYVIFSGHYDHLGYGRPNEKGDSLYNGANDDASGITAMLMLARYFKQLHNNERTLVFVAFTAEESGGFGSRYFSGQMEPAKVAAMFNIEMIGTDSKWGNNSAYITGYEKTDMGKILEKNLAATAFKFYPDPYPQQQLFYRSDNATLARLGVPAHTISTSKMDNEPHYHKASDEIGTLDMKNMTEIIKSIAISAQSIVAGKDTPTRVDTTQLR